MTLTSQAGESLTARKVYTFRRDEISGETSAPTFRNMALAIFDAAPPATEVWLMRSEGGQLLFIVKADGRWFDVRFSPIEVAS